MRNVVLLISLVATFLPNIEAQNYGKNLIAKLNNEIHRINDLITQIQEHYREEQYRHPRVPLPKNYESTLRRAAKTIGKALRLMRDIEEKNRRAEEERHQDDARHSANDERKRNSGESTRRSNDLNWKTNFYKALSRALKDEFKDEPIIQENIHDGFVPPKRLQKRGGQ